MWAGWGAWTLGTGGMLQIILPVVIPGAPARTSPAAVEHRRGPPMRGSPHTQLFETAESHVFRCRSRAEGSVGACPAWP
jgi:hypothetical protein